jgi:hypothetical protein
MFNRALLRKWLWHYVHEREAWWRVLVDSKFGSLWDGWCSNESLGSYGVALWKIIKKDWGKFSSHTNFEAGDGSNVRFWHDRWCEDKTVKEAFHDLYGIAGAKDDSDLAVRGMGGVLMSLMGRMRWSYGRILGRIGGSFQVIPVLRWEMVPRLDSCMIYGVGTRQ